MHRIIVVTGTDTGVGKTVFTALLVAHLRARGRSIAALKPICSGGRDDARVLRRALADALSLDEINPWHFRVPLAPLLAARKERKRIALLEVVSHVHQIATRVETVLVEGAGGVLSPLGENFSTRELINALGAEVIVVARNQIGVVNHVRLTLAALPPLVASHARVVLMSPKKDDAASRTNRGLLTELIGEGRVSVLPWFMNVGHWERNLAQARVRRTLDSVLH